MSIIWVFAYIPRYTQYEHKVFSSQYVIMAIKFNSNGSQMTWNLNVAIFLLHPCVGEWMWEQRSTWDHGENTRQSMWEQKRENEIALYVGANINQSHNNTSIRLFCSQYRAKCCPLSTDNSVSFGWIVSHSMRERMWGRRGNLIVAIEQSEQQQQKSASNERSIVCLCCVHVYEYNINEKR